MHRARFYKHEDDKIRCELCPHRCLIKENNTGICRVRRHLHGELFALNYGACASVALDPIEKKPLYHFYPGWDILSLGTWGCNFKCSFCQNWELAFGNPANREDLMWRPGDVFNFLRRGYETSVGIAYTYNEPTVWYEFVHDTAVVVHEHGYKNVLVTNGFITEEALEHILPFVDALNIDVKGFNDEFYRKYCKGDLKAVMKTVEKCVAAGRHVEITCLIVPSLNDSPDELKFLIKWLAGLNQDIPLHLSRYFPNFRVNLPATPVSTMEKARRWALENLNYVYLGNVPGHEGANTFCPRCNNTLIIRNGYHNRNTGLDGRHCKRCGRQLSLTGTFPKK